MLNLALRSTVERLEPRRPVILSPRIKRKTTSPILKKKPSLFLTNMMAGLPALFQTDGTSVLDTIDNHVPLHVLERSRAAQAKLQDVSMDMDLETTMDVSMDMEEDNPFDNEGSASSQRPVNHLFRSFAFLQDQ